MTARWSGTHSVAVVIAIALIAGVGWLLPSAGWAWVLTMVLMLALLVIVGLGIAGRPAGAWIDERNKMSLSRLQLIAWTVVVLSGFLVAALQNLRIGSESDPLAIAVPEILWLAMGISTVSLVGSPLILSTKKQRTAAIPEAERSLRQLEGPTAPALGYLVAEPRMLATPSGMIRAIGSVEVRQTPADASWADLFRGDETGNFAYVDLGKVQMFLLTLVVLLAYGLALFDLLSNNGPFHQLPLLSEGMIAILGISHAGYLSVKAVNHSTTSTE
jgi:hypothetical protein